MKHSFSFIDPHFLPHCRSELVFSLEVGDRLLITGENGLGKSTLLHQMWSEINGEAVLVEQKALEHFYDRTLLQFKQLLLVAREASFDQELFTELWKKFQLNEKEDRYLSALSGGEGQLLKLVVGLSQKSTTHLLDEPCQYLDQKKIEILQQTLKTWPKDKILVVIEHDQSWLLSGFRHLPLVLDQSTIRERKS